MQSAGVIHHLYPSRPSGSPPGALSYALTCVGLKISAPMVDTQEWVRPHAMRQPWQTGCLCFIWPARSPHVPLQVGVGLSRSALLGFLSCRVDVSGVYIGGHPTGDIRGTRGYISGVILTIYTGAPSIVFRSCQKDDPFVRTAIYLRWNPPR